MSTPSDVDQQQLPHVDLYTRNGFAGPAAMIIRSQYTPPCARVEGTYAPYRFDMDDLSTAAFADPEALPVAFLEGAGVSIESRGSRVLGGRTRPRRRSANRIIDAC